MFKMMSVVVFSACVLSMGLTGCGKSQNDEITEALKETYSKTDEEVAAQPEPYEKSAEWDTLLSTLQGIQIDDTVYSTEYMQEREANSLTVFPGGKII